MRRLRASFVLVIAAASPAANVTAASAQGVQVSGTVTVATDGAPLEGVSVQLKGTDIGVLTNSTGEYRINAPSAADTLIFTRLGFADESVPIASEGVVDVSLRQSPVDLRDLVVVGYRRSAGSGCVGVYDPMPGSVYDPNWQRANPELARLLLGECVQEAPDTRPPQLRSRPSR